MRELSEKLQLRFWLPLIDIILGRSYLMTGDLDKAWWHTDQALMRVDKHWSEKLHSQAWLVLGDIYRSIGENTRATEAYRGVINTEILSIQTIEGRYFLGVTLVNMGKIREALVWFNRAIDLSSQMGLTGLELRARITRLIISIGTKTLAQNKEDVDWLVKEVKDRGTFYGEFFSRWAAAIAPEKRGDTQLAIERYQDMVKYCEEVNAPFLELIPLQKILDLAKLASADRNQAKNEFALRIRDLSHKAATPPVKGYMQRMRKRTRKNWQYFVNGSVV
jgi:tetratricopeptide (TPR) repeat protein